MTIRNFIQIITALKTVALGMNGAGRYWEQQIVISHSGNFGQQIET